MLQRLRLINFRRHVDTELNFSNDAQIIAITGSNGSGKTTILEALTYALYGESRHGRRHLARLVRRGAEHEGMQVEVDFTIGDVQYELIRRHEKGKTSATLMTNGNRTMQTADGVTGEITKIFGMDSAGFRLAVIAQQFDVDGLADLSPARRRATITRLLRQDALTRAKHAAADEKNRQLSVVRAIGSGPDMDELNADLREVTEELESAQTALDDSEAALATLDKELAETSQTRARWQDVQLAVARAEATVAAAGAEVERLSREQKSIHVPDEMTPPDRPLSKIVTELTEVNIAVAKAKDGVELARVAEQTRGELDRIAEQLTALGDRLDGDTPASLAMAVSAADGELSRAQDAWQTARATLTELTDSRVEPAGQLAALRARVVEAAKLGAVCDTCEQPITAAHKDRQHKKRQKQEEDLVAQVAALDERIRAATTAATDAETLLNSARSERERLAARRQLVDAAVAERKDLLRRQTTYQERLERIQVPVVDLDGLYQQKADLETLKVAAEQYEQARTARTGALERLHRVATALDEARERLQQATAERTGAEPSEDLVRAHQRLTELEQQRQAEADMVAAVRAEVAAAVERQTAAKRLITAAQEQHERVRDVRAGADRAAKAARLLDVTAERMATQIRPALEGAISGALTLLSEGRFTSVQLSDSYEITVLDDDKHQPLTELSGGEQVLVALATRLALAEVVAGRHAAGGVGLLVLDEVFGSQDQDRRDAVLTGLRALRSTYGQILLISHVGGLDEAADHVLDVSLRVEDGARIAEVAVA